MTLTNLQLPEVKSNPNGWLPLEPFDFDKELPYQCFNKNLSLGKISDFTTASTLSEKQKSKYFGDNLNTSYYAYVHGEDESSFQLVDSRLTKSTFHNTRKNRFNYKTRGNTFNPRSSEFSKNNRFNKPRSAAGNAWNFGRNQNTNAPRGNTNYSSNTNQPYLGRKVLQREPSVAVQNSWDIMEKIEFTDLKKIKGSLKVEPTDLKKCGSVEFYDKAYDRVSLRNPIPLKRVPRVFHNVTTTCDPVMADLAKQRKGNIFMTDAILATLMCCTRSVYSWDIVIHKMDGALFFDHREKSEFNYLTVNETSSNTPHNDANTQNINSLRNLSLEAIMINANFSQQVLKMNEGAHKFEHLNHFADPDVNEELPSLGYFYRLFELPKERKVVVRCEVGGAFRNPTKGDVEFLHVRAFNEWDSKLSGGNDWRSKLDSQRGSVLATELKNNAFKVAKWTCCAILAGVHVIKFGYVSRVNPTHTEKHEVLETISFKPLELASQISLDMGNAWGIFGRLVDLISGMENGKYVIMKDPQKLCMRIYKVPPQTFVSSDSEDGDDEDEVVDKSNAGN